MEELSGAAVEHRYATRRAVLRDIYRETLHSINLRRVFAESVRARNGSLHITDLEYDLSAFRRVLLIAIGKAAVPTAEVVLGQLSRSGMTTQAVVIGPGDMSLEHGDVEHWPGSHPLPDASAREAAVRVVELLKSTDHRDLVLFLISGGASAMLELPLDAAITLDEIADFYRALVHSGLNIAEMNTLRKYASAVKGGRLAELAPSATKCTLLVSDVPEGKLDIIGSGPTLPDSSTRKQCWELLRRPELARRLPERIRTLLESENVPETPKHDAACFAGAEFRVLLSTGNMLVAAADACRRRGFHVVVDNTCDDWEYRDAAHYLLDTVRRLRNQYRRLCVLSGGEVLVELNKAVGAGGRNQQFALYCATHLKSMDMELSVLSAGTDGIDGNSPASGAVVDSTTLQRAREAGYNATEALDTFNAYPLLAGISDAIVTGPTGNNVRDLRIFMVDQT